MNTLPCDGKQREYRLTGNFLFFVVVVLLCGSAFIFLPSAPATKHHVSRLGATMDMIGLTSSQQTVLLQCCFAAIAVGVVAMSLLAPWFTKTLVVTAEHLKIVPPKIGGADATVLSLREIRNVIRVVRPKRTESFDFRTLRRLREEVRFDYGNSKFCFSIVQFRSYTQFEDFCTRIGAR